VLGAGGLHDPAGGGRGLRDAEDGGRGGPRGGRGVVAQRFVVVRAQTLPSAAGFAHGAVMHADAGLNPTFSTWSQVTMLHMYILSARFRCFAPAESRLWQQHLLDHFFYDAENRMMTSHNMHARATRNKYLKDLFIQWRGLLFAYDEGLVRGDPVLASAVWRNVFKGGERVDVRGLAAIVGYMRKSLMELDKIGDDDLKTGAWTFGSPKEEMVVVARRSRMMDAPFKEKIEEK